MKPALLLICILSICCARTDRGWADNDPSVSKRGEPSDLLKSFWNGIKDEWLPSSEVEYWREDQRAEVQKYAKRFAQENTPAKIVPELIKDLKAHKSVIRTFIYTWIIINWESETMRALLEPYYSGSDPVEAQIAGDFLAEIE